MFFTSSVEQSGDGANAVPENETVLSSDGPGKKRNKKRIAALIAAAAVLAAGIALFFLLRDKEPSVPDPAATLPVSETTEKATAAPEKKTTAAPTTVSPETTSDAISDFLQGEDALEKLLGCWNSADRTEFVYISRQDDGEYRFSSGIWYSDVGIVGSLTDPVSIDADGLFRVHLYCEGSDSDLSGISIPHVDDDIQFDLSLLNKGQVKLLWEDGWETYDYAGKTMEEAIPPLTPQYSFPVPPEGWEPHGKPADTVLTDKAMSALLKKMIGHWHIPDSRYFLIVRQEEDGTFSLGYAYFEGEIDEFGYLQPPFRGSAEETVGMRWYYKYYPTEDGYVMPDIDEDVYFDVSRLSENWIGWYRNGTWVKCCYAGRDIDDVYDYWRSHETAG